MITNLARVKFLDKSLYGELRDRDDLPPSAVRVARPPRPTRKARPERYILSIAEQLALVALRNRKVPFGEAAAIVGIPPGAAAAYYRFAGRQARTDCRDEQFYFGEVPVPPAQVIRCPVRQCSAVQTWYIPDPATGKSLPCRTCRLREWMRGQGLGSRG